MENAKFWQEFFQLYKDLPALWRIKSNEYSDRILKAKCYLKLIAKLREIHPDADREMVVKKINNFRTTYRKEMRKIKECQQSGREYKTTLWYYDFLSFLDEHDDMSVEGGSEGGKIAYKEDNTEEKIPSSQKVNTNSRISPQLPAKRCRTTKDRTKEEELPSTSIKPKIVYHKKPSAKLSLSSEQKQQAETDADIMGKSWSVQLRDMQPDQKLLAGKLISDVIFQGCMGNLNMSHVIDMQNILLRDFNWESSNIQPQSSIMESNSTFFPYNQLQQERYECTREASLDYNSSNHSMSPIEDTNSEVHVHDVKYEYP